MILQKTLDKNDKKLQKRPRLQEACLKLTAMADDLEPGSKLPPMTTLREQLGISLGTLSDAVHHLNDVGVLRSASGVGVYVANPSERRTTLRLGILFHGWNFDDIYTAKVLSGIRAEAAKHQLEITLLDEGIQSIESDSLDALILNCHETEALVLNIPEGLPRVLPFQHSANFPCVTPDDFEGAKMATEYLLKSGHSRIAYLSGVEHSSIVRRRVAGYYAAYREAGIEINDKSVRFLPDKPYTVSYRRQGEIEMTKWLQDDWNDLRCTALLAHNDHTAIGAMKALKSNGVRVPEDISIMGFDGTEVSELSSPTLTTIRVPLEEIGARTVKVLLEQIKEGRVYTGHSVLPVELKIGASVKRT